MSNVENKIDTYDYTTNGAGPITRFLWFCAGADGQLMARSPHSERVKEIGIGGVILATSVLAVLSGGYALNYVFDSVALAIGFGVLWGLVIFNLDRFIITATGHGDGTNDTPFKEWLQAAPRLIMAVIIGVCLSAPLEIRIFQTEIDTLLSQKEITEENQRKEEIKADFSQRRQAVDDRIEGLKKDYLRVTSEYSTQQERLSNDISKFSAEYTAEIAGKNGGLRNIGPVARGIQSQKKDAIEGKVRLERIYREDKADLDSKMEIARSEQSALDSEMNAQIEEMKKMVTFDGLAERIAISHENFPISTAFLMALLMMIEITPVITKMQIKNESYHYLMENQHELAMAGYAIEKKASVKVDDTKDMLNGKSNANEAVPVVYHQAETLLESEKSKLAVEKELTAVAHEAFLAKKKENPDALIKDSSAKASV